VCTCFAPSSPVAEPALADSLGTLEARSLVLTDGGQLRLTTAGRDVRKRAQTTRTNDLNELLSGWEPERHAEIKRLVDELAHSYASEIPVPTVAG
jgi:hypothetical protein